jgi:hypothetical protein
MREGYLMKKGVYSVKNNNLKFCKGDDIHEADLVFAFCPIGQILDPGFVDSLRAHFTAGTICGASCGSNIRYEELHSDEATVLALKFDKSTVKTHLYETNDGRNAKDLVSAMAKDLNAPDLKGICVIVDGFSINSGTLVAEMTEQLPNIPIFGGLASDGDNLETSYVIYNGLARKNAVIAIGLYGENLSVSNALAGGWQRFGPERVITKSHDNIVEEIDGKNAIDLYKEYLKKDNLQLPKDGLMLPLAVYPEGQADLGMTRSLIALTPDETGLVFAGDVPQGYHARFMTSSIQSLCSSAETAVKELKPQEDSVALAFSCIGHHMFLRSMTEDELQVLVDNLGENTPLVGFYTNGEICPVSGKFHSALHNQTTALALISEA